VAYVALPAGAVSAAAALSGTDYGAEAEWADLTAVLAASAKGARYGLPGEAPVLPVSGLAPSSG